MSLQILVTNFARLLLPGRSSLEEISTEKDRISQLPDDILASILSYLSVKEAVKTSVLSRRWKHVPLPHLHASRSLIKLDSTWAGLDFSGSHKGCQLLTCIIVQAINGFLNQYRGPNISLFEVDFCLGRKFASDIDRWITYAIKLGVEELNLSCSCYGCTNLEPQEFYAFSFQHLSEASELKRLSLEFCTLKRDFSFSGQFLSLKFLHLAYTAVDQSILLFILSRCPNLEGLRLRLCTCSTVLSFRGPFLRLKALTVSLCDGLEEIDISITTLTILEVSSGRWEFNIVLSGVPNLKTVYCDTAFCDRKQYISSFSDSLFSRIVNDVPQLQTLCVSADVMLVEYVPSMVGAFGSLKKLEFILKANINPFDIRKISLVLAACPLLQIFNLTLSPFIRGRWSKIEGRTMKEIPEFCHTQLREVEFFGFQGTETQLELAIYLLKNAVVLERMIISCCVKSYIEYGKRLYFKMEPVEFGKCMYRNTEPWTDGMHKHIIEELQGKAVSRNAELNFYRYLDECADSDFHIVFDDPCLVRQ